LATTEYDTFVAGLEAVPWFAAIGTHISEPNVVAMASWDEWPGPDCGPVERISAEQQAMRDLLKREHPEAMADFETLINRVLAITSARVPFNSEEDAWHAPSTAAWHAAWTAALWAAHLKLQIPPPLPLASQWRWFERGHWPAGYTESGALLVY
jgi:hypothetical protein